MAKIKQHNIIIYLFRDLIFISQLVNSIIKYKYSKVTHAVQYFDYIYGKVIYFNFKVNTIIIEYETTQLY